MSVVSIHAGSLSAACDAEPGCRPEGGGLPADREVAHALQGGQGEAIAAGSGRKWPVPSIQAAPEAFAAALILNDRPRTSHSRWHAVA